LVQEGRPPRNSFADCELAWTSFDRNPMVFNSRWSGFVKDSKEKRYAHPTQKALDVMKWCVLEFSNPGETVLDPFAGTGTSLVAAAMLSRRYIGIDKDEEYIKIAEERLRECVPTTVHAA
jgi:DNA modification methylase